MLEALQGASGRFAGCRGGRSIAVGLAAQELDLRGRRVLFSESNLGPLEAQQPFPVWSHTPQLRGIEWAGDQGVDRGYRSPFAVGELQCDRLPFGDEAHPQLPGSNRLQGYSSPGEGETEPLALLLPELCR